MKLGKVVKSFQGIVGRQSKSKHGKQGIHHHPQRADLGQNLPKGIQPGDRQTSYKGGSGGEFC